MSTSPYRTADEVAPQSANPNQPAPGNHGRQRLPVARLREWEALQRGCFICFGMSTYDGDEFSNGKAPSTAYAPDRLDVDQWVGVIRDAGFRYAVLTAKHVAGHCLWPTRYNDYHVGTSGNRTDVVAAFVEACRRRGVLPGLYYCSWDHHNLFGSRPPVLGAPDQWTACFTTEAYQEFQFNQLQELAINYGSIAEFWIDIPQLMPAAARRRQYAMLTELQPQACVIFNKAQNKRGKDPFADWPVDVMNHEQHMPPYSAGGYGSAPGHQPWQRIHGEWYYQPCEFCDTVNDHWFWLPEDRPKSDAELLGTALLCRSRNMNLLLDIAPDPHGVVPQEQVAALQRLHRNLERMR